MLPSVMSFVLVIAPTCSLAPRFSVLRPATLAAHAPGMTSGTPACTQQMQHLDSNQYDDATSRTGPGSGLPRVHVGRSTRGLVGRTPLMLHPSSYGSTSGRGLTSCCMNAGDTIGYNGVVLPPLPQRPPGARFLLSRSDAGTLTVSLPSRGIEAAISSISSSLFPSFILGIILAAYFYDVLALLLRAPTILVQPLLDVMLDAANAPVDSEVAANAIFGCAGASWLAARAFTTTTLSVGEFQWEYKETFAGVITTCYRQGPVEELDICLQDRQFELITGCKKICIGGHAQLSKEEADWVFQSISAVLAEVSV